MDPLQKEREDLIIKDIEKAEVLNGFLPQSLPANAPVKGKAGKGRDRGE